MHSSAAIHVKEHINTQLCSIDVQYSTPLFHFADSGLFIAKLNVAYNFRITRETIKCFKKEVCNFWKRNKL